MSTCNVVVVGAGPAGLLATINLLRFNFDQEGKELETPKYKVTIVDPNPDLGVLSEDELSKKYRSWMIGLSNQGLTAIKKVPGLFENYVSKVGVDPEVVSIRLGSRVFSQKPDENQQGYVVDRNYVVAALARFIHEKYASKPTMYDSHYNSRALYVDGDKKRIQVRNKEKDEDFHLSYDLLIGSDGVRSVVRGAFIQAHRTFEVSVSEIFNDFKSVHIPRHKSLPKNGLHLLPGAVPKMMGIALPETGDQINLAIGYASHNPPEDEVNSKDPKVVAEYFKKHFKCMELNDMDDFAAKWVAQSWSSTGQVHCNFYHSEKLSAIIMGDAAHATSPSIGMGMNTALGDAHALYDILLQFDHDLDKVLPEFSKERVKEGNALTDLSFHLNSLDTSYQMRFEIIDIFREMCNKFLPEGWVYRAPKALIGTGMKLSQVYDYATKMGRFEKIRSYNDQIRREFFEENSGMTKKSGTSSFAYFTGATFAFAAAMGVYGTVLLKRRS